MHILDGLLPPVVCISSYGITGGITWFSLRQISKQSDFQQQIPKASLLTAAALKNMGAKQVIVRAQTATHAEIFRRLGADEIVQPETEASRQLARRLANPHLEDVIELADGYSLIEIRAPAAFHGKTLEQLALRNKYRVNLVAVKRPAAAPAQTGKPAPTTTYVPHGGYTIQPDDILLLVGTDAALNSLPK